MISVGLQWLPPQHELVVAVLLAILFKIQKPEGI
jgi:hypothetical protein